MDKKRILVIDDEEILRMLIADSLERVEFEIEEVDNGEDGYICIANNKYDLIILDYMMPRLTGMELLEKIQPLDIQTPIIMLTAKAQQSDREMAHKFGASYFMPKPFSPAELVVLVEQIVANQVS